MTATLTFMMKAMRYLEVPIALTKLACELGVDISIDTIDKGILKETISIKVEGDNESVEEFLSIIQSRFG